MKMGFEKDTSAFISRQDINNFPFPYKLWLTVNSETCEFAKWNIDGTEIDFKIVALDSYLSSPKSIFRIKNRSSFIAHLRAYDFKMLKSECRKPEKDSKAKTKDDFVAWPPYSEFVMSFKHEHFLRHRIDLLAKIRKTPNIIPELPLGASGRNPSFSIADRMEGDLCFMSFGSMPQIQKCRIKYQTILNFQNETKILEDKLIASDIRSKAGGNQDGNEEDAMIELPAELFENPHDSVLYMGDEHRTAYAGFYGNCSDEQILNFFGEYLPMYESTNDEDGERRIADLNPSGRRPSLQPINFEVDYSLDADTTNQSVDMPQIDSPSPPPSSSLQPIFNPDDDADDISMEEFIKFKEQASENPTPDTPMIEESKIKQGVMNTEEDHENETNFKNFFSQYRESLSLLYEKQ